VAHLDPVEEDIELTAVVLVEEQQAGRPVHRVEPLLGRVAEVDQQRDDLPPVASPADDVDVRIRPRQRRRPRARAVDRDADAARHPQRDTAAPGPLDDTLGLDHEIRLRRAHIGPPTQRDIGIGCASDRRYISR
jgi:hypothetical protein